MYSTNDTINQIKFDGLKANKLLDFNTKEMLHISLEANAVFPKHTSSRNAYLLVLEGEIIFTINNKDYTLLKHQIFNFPKNKEHWVKAIQNSNFLIIR